MSIIIAPSILAADFGNLQRDCEVVNNSKADWFHLDIMDGVFVPNISFGMPVLKSINEYATKTLDVHLMIVNPEKYIEKFAELGSNILTIHYEVSKDTLSKSIKEIKKYGMKAGVAINPDTDINVLEDHINDIYQRIDRIGSSINQSLDSISAYLEASADHTNQEIYKLKGGS